MIRRGKYSLDEFLGSGRIIIPMIQRDYAQGRLDKKVTAIRESFLGDIMDCLCGDKQRLDLDFVFGTFDEGERSVLPIDGQQRLTTLFLTYWYFGKLPRTSESNVEAGNRALFSYSARRIASQFVAELLKDNPRYDWSAEDVISPEKWLAGQPWFRPVWKRDATVFGMLTTLRTLHAIVADRKARLSSDGRLPDPERLRLITFYFDPMEHVNADEGYRKMNARGRGLSDWENIKSVVEDGVYKKGFDVDLRDRWMNSISGEWVSAMESYLPEPDYGRCVATTPNEIAKYDDAVDSYVDKQVERFNEGFRNLLDLAIYFYAVRNVGKVRTRYLAIVKQINREGICDYTPLERLFGERADELGFTNQRETDALTSVILCGKEVARKDWVKSRIVAENENLETWQQNVWKKLMPIVLSYYEKLFRQHNASPVDYGPWIVPDVVKCAIDFFDVLKHSGDAPIRGWRPLDRALCLATGWTSKNMRNANWFWSRLTDAPQNSECKFTAFCNDFLFVRSDTQKQSSDNVTAVRYYVLSKVLSQKLSPDREFAARHLYNLLDNQDSIGVEKLGVTLEFVDRLFESPVGKIGCKENAQKQCLCDYRNEVFAGCKMQMEEEVVKADCNQRGDFRYLEYEKEYSAFNGTVGFLINAKHAGFDEILHDKFNEVVWCNGALPRQGFFEVIKASTNDNFRPTNEEKLRIPSDDGKVDQWKYNLIRPLWRRIFADYAMEIAKDILPEVAFLLNAGDSIFDGMSYLWRHRSDGRLYLNRTDGKLCTYVWLTYTDRARAILDALGVSFVTSSNATYYPLSSLGCDGYFMDISPALCGHLDVDIRLRKGSDKNWEKKIKIDDIDKTGSEINRVIENDQCSCIAEIKTEVM